MSKTKQLIEEASNFITVCYKELNKEKLIKERMNEILIEIEKTGTYEHTFEELVHGCEWHGVIVIDALGDYFGVRCTY